MLNNNIVKNLKYICNDVVTERRHREVFGVGITNFNDDSMKQAATCGNTMKILQRTGKTQGFK